MFSLPHSEPHFHSETTETESQWYIHDTRYGVYTNDQFHLLSPDSILIFLEWRICLYCFWSSVFFLNYIRCHVFMNKQSRTTHTNLPLQLWKKCSITSSVEKELFNELQKKLDTLWRDHLFLYVCVLCLPNLYMIGQKLERGEEVTNILTSVKLVSNDNKECDTCAKTVQSNSWRAGKESWSPINSFQNIL